MEATGGAKSSQAGSPLFTAGTLSYTRAQLLMLSFWLLWGYFVYALMEAVPTLLPILLKQHHASNRQLTFIATSLNVIGNLVFVPIVSYGSDRYRSRWGRRRPFIVYSTPLVVAFLALVPFGPDIARRLQEVEGVRQVLSASPIAPAVLMIAVFVAGFQVFDTFVASVYYYLVRDTVPEACIGRFYGTFRLVGALPPLVFNLFVFGHAETCMKAIFVGIACFYGLGILLMCWRVREGEFPPPEPLAGGRGGAPGRAVAAAGTYVRECFGRRHYLLCFLAHGVAMWANAGLVFAVLFRRDELGVSLAVQGRIASAGSVLMLAIALPCGHLADRFNCFRLVQFSLLAKGIVAALAWRFVHDTPTLLAATLLSTVPETLLFTALVKLLINLFPRERYGQFGSANSAVASLGTIGIALLVARFADWMGDYRSYLVWMAAFSFAACLLYALVERVWDAAERRPDAP